MGVSDPMPNRLSLVPVLLVAILCLAALGTVPAATATDFSGTVLTVDPAAGKLAVKKDGTRFTFVVTDKTQFAGPGLKSLKDVKKGDSVTVSYEVKGAQYLAEKITAKGK